MKNLRFVIFAAGKGKRMASLTRNFPKVLLEINKKALICYPLDIAKLMGAKEVFIVVDYEMDKIKFYLKKKYKGVKISYIENRNSKGHVHNFLKVGNVINSDFVLLLGDEIYSNSRHKNLIPFFKKLNPDGICGVREETKKELIKKSYSIELSKGKIIKLKERPRRIVNNFRGWGTYIFRSDVFDFIDKAYIDARTKKKEISGLIQAMVDSGKIFLPFDLRGDLINVNTKEDLIVARNLFEIPKNKF